MPFICTIKPELEIAHEGQMMERRKSRAFKNDEYLVKRCYNSCSLTMSEKFFRGSFHRRCVSDVIGIVHYCRHHSGVGGGVLSRSLGGS